MKATGTAIIIILFAIAPSFAESGDKAWLDWFKPVNVSLRTATSYLRTDNGDFAALSLEELIENVPPVSLSRQLATAATNTLSEASAVLDQIEDGHGPAARKRLQELRQALFEINQKNGIEVFDDCIWSVHKAGPALWWFRNNKPDLADAKQREAVMLATNRYLFQLEKCDTIVPHEIKMDEEWRRVALSAIISLRRIKMESIPKNDVGMFIRLVRELISFDHILYFRYG